MILRREDKLSKPSGKVLILVKKWYYFSAQNDLNMRMDEDEALQEAIKRSLNCWRPFSALVVLPFLRS